MKIFENNKNNSAITLIALVITIIILLILAGITIATLTNSGLFSKSQEAKEKQEDAQKLENLTLADYEEQIDTITGDRGNKVTYSTEEQEIGTWIDGKTLYRRVFVKHFDSLGTTVQYVETELKGKDVNAKKLDTYVYFANGGIWNISNYTGYDWSDYDTNGIKVRLHDTYTNIDVVAILEYTK